MAELKKENGNQLYKIKQYRSALPFYTEAINLCPDVAAYYGNRAACYIMLNRFEEALEDVRQAVQLDPMFVRGYVRMAKCGLALGNLTTAEYALKKVKELQPEGNAAANEEKSFEKIKQYENEAKKSYDRGKGLNFDWLLEEALI